MGNRIYGCDDCQLICPWNRYAQLSEEIDFAPRKLLHQQQLITLFKWDEATFLKNTEGSAIRRIGIERWQRNIAVALGNADYDPAIVEVLNNQYYAASPLVQEHIQWAIEEQKQKQQALPAVNRKTRRLVRSIEKGCHETHSVLGCYFNFVNHITRSII